MLNWQIGNRTFLTSLAASALLAFLAINNIYAFVPIAWEPIIVKAAGALFGVSVYYLRDALKRLDEKLSSWQTTVQHNQPTHNDGKSA